MEMLQLRYFYESARTQSLSKTASKYMVPASSVSASIKRLESELGCQLFERTANRITLSEGGKRLQRSLSVIFEELDGALLDLSGGLADTREVRILVRALRADVTDHIIRYKKTHTGAKFRLVADFEQTDTEEYDIIVDTQKDSYQGYDFFELDRQRVQLYAAADSPLTRRALSLCDLAAEPFVTMSPRGNQYALLMNACARAGFVPQLLAQINDADCFFKLIAGGAAIGAAGEGAANEGRGIAPLDVRDFDKTQTVCVYYRREGALGSVRKFIEFLKKSAQSAQKVL
jgi:DNA-binding transcriptional LysR family regulator